MGRRARILIVEDDRAIRLLLKSALQTRGHEIYEAGDGEEGLRLAHETSPELVLLDLGLPAVHGSAVLDRLKADGDLSGVPVIVVSAWGEAIIAEKARAHGAVDVVRKPFDIDDLLDRVDAALAGDASS